MASSFLLLAVRISCKRIPKKAKKATPKHPSHCPHSHFPINHAMLHIFLHSSLDPELLVSYSAELAAASNTEERLLAFVRGIYLIRL